MKRLQRIAHIIAAIGVIISYGMIIVIRSLNPELTETELAIEFWPYFFAVMLVPLVPLICIVVWQLIRKE